MIEDLVLKTRSYRRFRQDEPVGMDTLRRLVDLARITASAANFQPLKYILSADADRNARIFPHLKWAGYLRDWPGPAEGERPAAYVVILCDTRISRSPGCDHGIAAQTILLAAAERGIGGCMIGSIDKEKLRAELGIEPFHSIVLVVALGYPAEKVVLETVGPDGDIRYWRDEEGVHHVPKRPLEEVIVEPGPSETA